MKARRYIKNSLVCLLLVSFLASILRGLGRVSVRDRPDSRSTHDEANEESCFSRRIQGYWDFSMNSMRFNEKECDDQMETLVQEPNMPNPLATSMTINSHTKSNLLDRLEGSCILLFGDSTDRQITESWCPRWMTNYMRRRDKAIQLWSPKNSTNGKSIRDHILAGKVWNNGGLRCSPGGKFTFGSYMHYGVGPPPVWKFAHTYQTDLPHEQLRWGNTTKERIERDLPVYFQDCDARGHNRLRIVVVQSYLWDLARIWMVQAQERPPLAMLKEWAMNATRLVTEVRAAVPPGSLIAWRLAGPLATGQGRDSDTIEKMNEEFLRQRVKLDFIADYGSILGSELIRKSGPFPAHPPALPRTAYLNLLLNAILSFNTTSSTTRP